MDGGGQKAPEKIVSAMRSEMRALAEAAGLDPEVAAAMVDEDVEIEGVVEAGKLLTLTTEEAVGIGYAESVDDLAALLDELDAQGAQVVTLEEMAWAATEFARKHPDRVNKPQSRDRQTRIGVNVIKE